MTVSSDNYLKVFIKRGGREENFGDGPSQEGMSRSNGMTPSKGTFTLNFRKHSRVGSVS